MTEGKVCIGKVPKPKTDGIIITLFAPPNNHPKSHFPTLSSLSSIFPGTVDFVLTATGHYRTPELGKGHHWEREVEATASSGCYPAFGIWGLQPGKGDHLADGGKHEPCECLN